MPLFGLFGPPNVEKLEAKRNVKGLIKALRYKASWDVRAKAAKALGQIGDARAVEPLGAALQDKETWVRQAAARALGQIKDLRAIESLTTVLSDPDIYLRKAVIEALKEIRDARVVEPLVEALEDSHPNVRIAAIEALREVGDARAVESLVAILKESGVDLRKESARALGQIGDAQAVEPLVEVLQDEFYDVRVAAAEALKRLDWQPIDDSQRALQAVALQEWEQAVELGATGVRVLLAALKTLGSYEVRHEAVEALVQFGDTRAVEPLAVTLKETPYSELQGIAAKVLGEIGDARAVEPLVEVLKDVKSYWSGSLKDWETHVRKKAAAALGQIGDARAVGPLVEALQDKDASMRWEAAETLGQIGDARAVGPLVEALQDENQTVRWHAAAALGQIGDARAVEPLIMALEVKGTERWSGIDLPETAAVALGQIGDARAVEPLVIVLRDNKDPDVWIAAVEALERIDPEWMNLEEAKKVVPTFETALAALKGKDKNVGREQAAGALGLIKDARAVEPLVEALQTQRTFRLAVWALGQIGDARAVGPLVTVIKETPASTPTTISVSEDKIRDAAMRALVKIGIPAVESLVAMLKDPNPDARTTAASALVQIGDTRAVEPLVGLTADNRVAGRVIMLLEGMLKKKASDIEPKILYQIVNLNNVVQLSVSYTTDLTYKESPGPVDCSRVKRLARQELVRRG